MTVTKIPRSIKPSSSTLLYGVGNSGSYYEWGAANKKAMEFRFKSNAVSGDSRGMYMRLKLAGAGGGEAARFFANASAANVATGGTINGVHASMSVDAACSVSGAGNGLRATLGAAAESRTLTGTCAALQLDSDIGTGNTVPASWAFIRTTDSSSVRLANFMNIPNVANGTLFAAHDTQGLTHSIKFISADGTPYYLMCTDADTNRS